MESRGLVGCADKIGLKQGWYARTSVATIMDEMVRHEIALIGAS